MSKIILLNGPKACGKNVAVDRIKDLSSKEVIDRRCKDHLFTLTAAFFKMTMEEFNEHYECRETKEEPKSEFSVTPKAFNKLAPIISQPTMPEFSRSMMLSVREALIYVSEVICKPTFGRNYFGVVRAEAIDVDSNEWSIDDSCGFDDEIAPTTIRLGMDNVMLIRIYGRGSFEGDSRSYINNGVVDNTVDVYNTDTEELFLREVSDLALDFYDN